MPINYTIYEARLKAKITKIQVRKARRVIDDMHDMAVRGARGGPYSKGTLAASIYKEGPTLIGKTVIGEVGSRLNYAASVERGAEVHAIFPKGAAGRWRFNEMVRSRHGPPRYYGRPQLRFIWHGRIVYTPHVPMGLGTVGLSHPGQTGKHFLLKAAIKTAAKHRMKLIPGVDVF